MTIQDLLKAPSPVDRGERALLLAHAMGMPKEYLIVHPETKLPAGIIARFRKFLARRAKHEPFAYIVGEKEFYGRMFSVNKDVLIPRPETELLIETVLDSRLRGNDKRKSRNDSILDIGCGSGAIGLTLAAELPKARVVCADISAKALTVARKNAKRLGVAKRVTFKRMDVLQKGSLHVGRDDKSLIITANLPYLPERTWKKAAPDVRKFEPKLALASGKDGLDHYRALMARLAEAKIEPRLLLLEAEPDQMEALEDMVQKALPRHETMLMRDIFGDDRVLVAQAN